MRRASVGITTKLVAAIVEAARGRMVGDNPVSFTLLMTLTKLATTIMNVFGMHSALALSLDLHT